MKLLHFFGMRRAIVTLVTFPMAISSSIVFCQEVETGPVVRLQNEILSKKNELFQLQQRLDRLRLEMANRGSGIESLQSIANNIPFDPTAGFVAKAKAEESFRNQLKESGESIKFKCNVKFNIYHTGGSVEMLLGSKMNFEDFLGHTSLGMISVSSKPWCVLVSGVSFSRSSHVLTPELLDKMQALDEAEVTVDANVALFEFRPNTPYLNRSRGENGVLNETKEVRNVLRLHLSDPFIINGLAVPIIPEKKK